MRAVDSLSEASARGRMVEKAQGLVFKPADGFGGKAGGGFAAVLKPSAQAS